MIATNRGREHRWFNKPMSLAQILRDRARVNTLMFICLTGAFTFSFAQNGGGTGPLLPIFNGTNLSGWRTPDPNPFWRIENGVLIGENDAGLTGNVLFTERSYTNFVLELEARWSGEIDSGVMLRQPELQLQFGISRSLKKDMTCCFYTGGKEKYPATGHARGAEKLLKDAEWNRFRLEAMGDTFIVWLNGQQVASFTNATFTGGAPIGLQIHPKLRMRIEFRNIRAKALE